MVVGALALPIVWMQLLPIVASYGLSSSSSVVVPIHIAVTRESGKNEKLIRAIQQVQPDVTIHELPCIEHAKGPDFDRLELSLYDDDVDPWDYVIVTSPEAASVLGQVWDDAASVQPRVAAVGAATAIHLQQTLGIAVAFVPSRATAADLARELPSPCRKVLYVASAQAPHTLCDGLAKRNIATERLNAYDTVSAVWKKDATAAAAEHCSIVCLASPSAVQGWIANTSHRPMAICIGKTTADACWNLGFDGIRYPENPGLEGWVQLIHETVLELQAKRQNEEKASTIRIS
jgi:uroporphyrinogen-III synthase